MVCLEPSRIFVMELFWLEALMQFSENSCIVVVRLGSKYASVYFPCLRLLIKNLLITDFIKEQVLIPAPFHPIPTDKSIFKLTAEKCCRNVPGLNIFLLFFFLFWTRRFEVLFFSNCFGSC